MVRFKNRYFLCEIISEDSRFQQCIDEWAVHNTVKNVVARMHGDFGLACCSIAFSVKYLNAYTGIVLLCCRKDFHRLLWSSLPFITHLESRNQRYPCSFNTLHVGAPPLEDFGKGDIPFQVYFTPGWSFGMSTYAQRMKNTYLSFSKVEHFLLERVGRKFQSSVQKLKETFLPAVLTLNRKYLLRATIRTCQKFLIHYNRNQLLVLLRNCTSEADRHAIQESVQSCMFVEEEQFHSKDEESDDDSMK